MLKALKDCISDSSVIFALAIVVLYCLVVLTIVFLSPFALIYCLNVLGANIPYTFSSWLAIEGIFFLLRFCFLANPVPETSKPVPKTGAFLKSLSFSKTKPIVPLKNGIPSSVVTEI